MTRRPLFFYCQHSLGLGHLARSRMLAEALSTTFQVTMWCGGAVPEWMAAPASYTVAPLVPIEMDADGRLTTTAANGNVEAAFDVRRRRMLRDLEVERPAAIVVELFPFGRTKFAGELLPLLQAAASMTPRPLLVCSVRDILVDRGDHQAEHDSRAAAIVDRYLDAVLVHGDPEFSRLEEFFRPRRPLRTPIHYTGFVVRPAPAVAVDLREGILVSGGGGRFATRLFETAIEAYRRRRPAARMTIVTGPFCTEATRRHLATLIRDEPSIRVQAAVNDLPAAMARSELSISQCGYNTALEIARARVPALVVPFDEKGETEQAERARRLAERGLVRVLPAGRLDAAVLADEIERTRSFRPAPTRLDFDGARGTARLVTTLLRQSPAWSRCRDEQLA